MAIRNKRSRLLAGTAAILTTGIIMVFVSGCGGSADEADPPAAAVNIARPAPDTVEMIDSLNDISASDEKLESAPSFLDISSASISRGGGQITFTMELSSALPETPQPGAAAEWAFLLDTDQDGAPDWGIFADLTSKDGWLPGIFNQKTRQRLAGPQFPGTLTHSGTTLVLTVDAAAIGSPESFKWFAYSDAALAAGSKTQKAGDKIWEPAVPDNSRDWLPFP